MKGFILPFIIQARTAKGTWQAVGSPQATREDADSIVNGFSQIHPLQTYRIIPDTPVVFRDNSRGPRRNPRTPTVNGNLGTLAARLWLQGRPIRLIDGALAKAQLDAR